MIENLDAHNFAGCLRTEFQAHVSEAIRQPLELIEVKELNYSPGLEQFSLIFTGSLTPVLEQRVYCLEHQELGALQLFLVPIGTDSEGKKMRYEVAFSRFRRGEK